jgi:hypothetical protein
MSLQSMHIVALLAELNGTKNCKQMFGEFGKTPKEHLTPLLDKDDHPELNTTTELDIDGIKKAPITHWSTAVGSVDKKI